MIKQRKPIDKRPKCRHCKDRFYPLNGNTNQKHCLNKEECRKIGLSHLIEQEKKKQEREQKKRFKELDEALQTLPQKKDKLQRKINEIARLIDKGHPCMMCGNPRMKRINGCHYHSVGSNDTIRFNLHNIWAGCHSCNHENGGNINGYDLCLLSHFDNDYWEEIKFGLVREYKTINLTKQDVNEKIKIANEIIAELKKANKVYDNLERVELRDKYNKRLGMYL